MNEKELIENRNAKVNEMEGIVNLAKEEKRVITDEEKQKFENLKKEIENIDNTISMENEVKNMELKEVKEVKKDTMSVEEKERKQFENVIRGIRNDISTFTTVADGQVTIPTTIASRIIDRVIEISPIYARADRYNIRGNVSLPKYDATNSSLTMTWADEGSDATSGELKLGQIQLTGYLGRALALISNDLINNSEFDIVGFVIDKMAQAIALFIEKALLGKDTANKVEGLKGIPAEMIVTSEDVGEINVDDLMDTQDKVIDNYQGEAIWIMNRTTRNAIRKLKDSEGQYLLNKDLTAKWGYTLLGKDVYCSDAMDEIGQGKVVAYYGDFSGLAVKMGNDMNMSILRELYAPQHLTGVLAFVEGFDAKVADTQKMSKLVVKSATPSV